MTEKASTTEDYRRALEANAARYEVHLSAPMSEQLCDYYQEVQRWNRRVHLVAPCSPAEFATRHVLESLLATVYLPLHAHVADIGSGAGLPIIPCLIARADIRATLYEASLKKAVFLRETLRRLNLHDRTVVIAERFERRRAPEINAATCRALDRFTELFSTILAWCPKQSTLLLFGGHALREKIEDFALSFRERLIPLSNQRYLFIIKERPITQFDLTRET
jgi:16S rRNA (guanine527-N7)-methyltransferase